MKQRNSYTITEQARKRFKKWLIDEDISMSEFARRCNVSKQYISSIITGKNYITAKCREIFRKGGYELI